MMIQSAFGNKIAEYRGGWAEAYVYVGGQMVVHYGNGTTWFRHVDHLGSTRLMTRLESRRASPLDDNSTLDP